MTTLHSAPLDFYVLYKHVAWSFNSILKFVTNNCVISQKYQRKVKLFPRSDR